MKTAEHMGFSYERHRDRTAACRLIGSVRRVKNAVKLGASGFKLPVLVKPGRDPEIGYERTVPCKVAGSIGSNIRVPFQCHRLPR